MAQLPPTEAIDTGSVIITVEYWLRRKHLLTAEIIAELSELLEDCITRCNCYRVWADIDRRAIVDLRIEQLRTLQSHLGAATPAVPNTTTTS